MTLFACGWYPLNNGKVHLIRVIFDSGPLDQRKRTRPRLSVRTTPSRAAGKDNLRGP